MLSIQNSLSQDTFRFYKNRQILITGAGGFLGSRLVSLLSGISCRILCLSTSRETWPEIEPKAQLRTMRPDYANPEFWKKILPGTDIIFHLASQTSLSEARNNPDADFRANVLPMMTLLEACRTGSFKLTVIFTGTATQTGLPSKLPVDENVSSNPLTVYDLHKQLAEDYLKFYAREKVVSGVCLRLSNIYGPCGTRPQSGRGILNEMIRRALRGEPITIYGEGAPVRDYLYIDDAVSALLNAAIHAGSLNAHHYMIGSGKGYPIAAAFRLARDIAERIRGVRAPVDYVSMDLPVIESRHYVADIRKFSEMAKWLPETTLPEGIEKTIKAWGSEK